MDDTPTSESAISDAESHENDRKSCEPKIRRVATPARRGHSGLDQRQQQHEQAGEAVLFETVAGANTDASVRMVMGKG